jgi:CDGSH-type Zn-finger protein/nucleotide-binding universal stress UspA family protein/nitrite reductase/ring-hydroxylating ferredoxin subunit
VHEDRSEIAVTPDGPYEVSGALPITPKRIIRSPDGESLAWATSDPLPHDSPTYLCRCGQSENKPFCDGSHERVGFDGTETASVASFEEMERIYEGTGIEVHRVGSICEHAAFCVNSLTDWYRLLPNTSDVGIRTQVIGMIEHCPSGALVYEIDDEVVEPDLPKAVSPVEDGALWVTGGVKVTRSDGVVMETRNRVTLCRCGQSSNKPLCDGTHLEIGFVAKTPTATAQGRVRLSTAERSARVASRRVVVGASEASTSELFETAAKIADDASMDVAVVVVGTDGEVSARSRARLREMAATAGMRGPGRTWESTPGDPVAALTHAAERLDAGLIIVERGGDHLARLPHRVAYEAPADMIVVAPRGPDRTDGYETVLIATDGSVTADRAAKKGYDFARAHGAAVELVFVGHRATGELTVKDTVEVFGQGVETTARLMEGDPVERILAAADEAGADIIVVGNKGLRKRRLGSSVPGAVLDGARCDVLLCRTVRQVQSDLSFGEAGIIERHGEAFAAYVDERGELHLMSAHCPHLGCLVEWNPTDEMFVCPCHGSRFTPLGEVVEGPATKPLRPAREH